MAAMCSYTPKREAMDIDKSCVSGEYCVYPGLIQENASKYCHTYERGLYIVICVYLGKWCRMQLLWGHVGLQAFKSPLLTDLKIDHVLKGIAADKKYFSL